LFAGHLFANIIYIPSDYPTIQQGINAAQTGDTVMVAAATYAENIVWPSRDGIRLMSEDGAATTIIDGGAAGRVITLPNFSFTSSTVVTGFTIQNGQSTRGAGIYIYGSPYILENIIQRNIASAVSGLISGAGILCDRTGTPLIVGNLIRGNVLRGTDWNYGAGIYVDDENSALILGNTIESDSAIGGSWNYGAGIYCATGSSPDIRHNVIQGNVATQGSRGHGAGIYVGMNSSSYILSNLIYNNTSQSGLWNYGAGILINSGAEVLNNTIVGNRCLGGTWNYGAGIRIYDSTNTIGNNIVVNNSATTGGVIYAGIGDHATLLNNDVWNNTGGNYSGIAPGANDISVNPLFVTGPLGDFYLSQIAAGQGKDSPCIDYGFASAAILELDTYTTRTDSVTDFGVVDLGYHYPIESFAVGIFEVTGFTAVPKRNYILLKWRTETESNSAFWYIYKRDIKAQTVYKEIGRLEGHGSTPSPHDYTYMDSDVSEGNIYSYKLKSVKIDGSTRWYGPVSAVVTGTKTYLNVSPNPFRDRVNIEYSIGHPNGIGDVFHGTSRAEGIELEIFDAAGRSVKNFILYPSSFILPAKLEWNGKDDNGKLLPSGVYYCRLTQGSFIETRKILFVK